jgi:hypothetical protein
MSDGLSNEARARITELERQVKCLTTEPVTCSNDRGLLGEEVRPDFGGSTSRSRLRNAVTWASCG